MDGLEALLAFGGSFASSALLGIVKKNTTIFDRKIGAFIKPAQPFIVAGLSVALPFLANALGVTDIGTADAWANATTATLVTVSAREAYLRLSGQKLQPATR